MKILRTSIRLQMALVLVSFLVIPLRAGPAPGGCICLLNVPSGTCSPAEAAQCSGGTTQVSPDAQQAAQIRGALQGRGLAVYDVGLKSVPGIDVPVWWAQTAAYYVQPTWDDVLRQGLVTWYEMNNVLAQDRPDRYLYSSQVWTRYAITLRTQRQDYVTYAQAYSQSASYQQQVVAWRAFLSRVLVWVYDFQTRQFVDLKDFVNRNFIGS